MADRILAHTGAQMQGEESVKARQKIKHANVFPPLHPLPLPLPCTVLPSRAARPLHHDVGHQDIPTENPDSSAGYSVCCCWQNTDGTVPQHHEKIHPKDGRKEQNEPESKVQL